MWRKLFVALFIMGLAQAAAAQYAPDPVDRYTNPLCRVTPQIGVTNYPGFNNIMTSNKLAIPPGKSIYTEGQLLYVYGRLYDENCVPLSNAKVEIWHADPYGTYRYAKGPALATPDATFAGAGRTTTDNLGEFMFLTVYPGAYGSNERRQQSFRAPHINLRVTHDNFRTYNTVLYFANDTRNMEDRRFNSLSAIAQSAITMQVASRDPHDWNNGAQAAVDIVIPGKDPFRRY